MECVISNNQVKRFQNALPLIRTALGLKSEEVAKLVDISRPYVVAMENNKINMTVVCCLALYWVLYTLAKNTNNATALSMFDLLVDIDNATKVPDEIKDICIEKCNKARLDSPRKRGMKEAKKNVCAEYEKWLKNEYYRTVYHQIDRALGKRVTADGR